MLVGLSERQLWGSFWGMGARKKPKTPDEVCFWRVKANFFGAMAYSRRSGSLPGCSVDDPGDPPLWKALAAARISSRCCAGAGEVELR